MRVRVFGLLFLAVHTGLATQAVFRTAKPVWLAGKEKEMNLLAGFRTVINLSDADRPVLRVTACNLYRAFLNGEFVGHGPARGPHGFFRVDEWDLTGKTRPGVNVVAIEVASYNVDNYYLPNQAPFLQAEVISGGKVLASTSGAGVAFEGRLLRERVQKVERYSFQRTFTEAYRLGPGYDAWRREAGAPFEAAAHSGAQGGRLLLRRVPYPDFDCRQPLRLTSTGSARFLLAPAKPMWKGRMRNASFPEAEFEVDASLQIQKAVTELGTRIDRPLTGPVAMPLPRNTYAILDLGTNLTGFVGLRVTCPEKTRLLFAFDEILTNDDVDFKRLGTVSVVVLDLEAGNHDFETIEPYTLRYLKLIAADGDCRIENVYMREYANPNVWRAHFASSDTRLKWLFDAGRETFRQNAVDIFMDCPHRERAGWLCDSFFTARVARDLGGDTAVEEAFLENFLLPETYPSIPKCMLPMCYPADHAGGRFIPNWALWFVLELEEYLARSGDSDMVKAFEPKVMCLFDYFKQFRNSDGLLEKLPSWVFIEWSAANKFVQDVNYPSNMLYAGALAAAGRLYRKPEMLAESIKVHDAIRRQSFDGEFFVDNAVRKGEKLEVSRNRTEVCQYFAFYFGTATPESHPKLWAALRDQFGPERMKKGLFLEVHQANSFIGNMVRAELLSREGLTQQLLDESVSYLLYMVERTGTLWENVDPSASCNHGFASHIVHTLYRDVLGVSKIDPVARKVRLRLFDLRPQWCEGEIPTRDGRVAMRWWKGPDRIYYRLRVPAGYSVEVENRSGKKLIAHD